VAKYCKNISYAKYLEKILEAGVKDQYGNIRLMKAASLMWNRDNVSAETELGKIDNLPKDFLVQITYLYVGLLADNDPALLQYFYADSLKSRPNK